MAHAVSTTEHDEWTPGPGECSACGIMLGEGRGQCRPATGTTLCLDCATTLYDPTDPTDPIEYDETP